MTREAKVGLMMVAVLVGVFGFLFYKRMHRPPEVFAEQVASVDTERDDDSRDAFSDEAVAPRRLEHDAIRVVKHEERGIVRKVESAVKTVEKMAVEVIEEVDPFAKDRRPREKTRIPVDLSAEDDFSQFQKPRDKAEVVTQVQLSEPAEDAFGDVKVQRASARRAEISEASSDPDPFASDRLETPIRTTEFSQSDSGDRSVPNPSDSGDGAFESRSSREPMEFSAPQEEPRRTRDFDSRSEPAPRERRRAAPAAFVGDTSPSEFTEQPPAQVGGPSYVVQPNDNFWSISRKQYGAGRYYMALAMHNREKIPDPKMMKPGIVVSTPDVAFLEKRYPESIPKVQPVDSAPSVTTSQSRKPVETENSGYFMGGDGAPMYRVGDQDTLSSIAKSHLGRASRWVQIREMNRNVLRDGTDLKIGTVLRLPADASRVQVVGTGRDYR